MVEFSADCSNAFAEAADVCTYLSRGPPSCLSVAMHSVETQLRGAIARVAPVRANDDDFKGLWHQLLPSRSRRAVSSLAPLAPARARSRRR